MNLALANLCFKISDGLMPIPQEHYGDVSEVEQNRYAAHNGRIIIASDAFSVAGIEFADGDYLKGFKHVGRAIRELFS